MEDNVPVEIDSADRERSDRVERALPNERERPLAVLFPAGKAANAISRGEFGDKVPRDVGREMAVFLGINLARNLVGQRPDDEADHPEDDDDAEDGTFLIEAQHGSCLLLASVYNENPFFVERSNVKKVPAAASGAFCFEGTTAPVSKKGGFRKIDSYVVQIENYFEFVPLNYARVCGILCKRFLQDTANWDCGQKTGP